MAEATKDRTEQTFQRAEDTMGTIMENSRQTWQSMFEYNRNSIRTGYEFARTVQEESLRLTDAWLDQIVNFQKSYMKNWQSYNTRFQDMTERTARENTDRIEEAIDQSLELVTPGGRTPGKRR